MDTLNQNPLPHTHFRRALMVWLAVMLAIRGVAFFQFIPFIESNLAAITAMLMVYPPLVLGFKSKEALNYCRVKNGFLIRSLKAFVLLSLAIFPALFVLNHFYQSVIFGAEFHAAKNSYWFNYILIQAFAVAFPEEFFFRGYLYDRFVERFPHRFTLFGAPFGWGMVWLSLLFAFSHSLISLQWWHVFIFFPSLAFCWLRAKSGVIWGSVLFHLLSNLFSYWVALHY